MMKLNAFLKRNFGQHFDFGENWKNFSRHIDRTRLAQARADLLRLLDPSQIEGARIIDIGCGSGLNAAAFLTMNCEHLTAIDYDPIAVATTINVINQFHKSKNWLCYEGDILNVQDTLNQKYNIVYSWGVLHHTGNLNLAIENTIDFCDEDGFLVLALYLRTPFCTLWKIEKVIYKSLNPFWQTVIRKMYIFCFSMVLKLKGINLKDHKANYVSNRGMSYEIDVHDWLGGFPYESIKESVLVRKIEDKGFKLIRSHIPKLHLGIFGSGCGEFVFQKSSEFLDE